MKPKHILLSIAVLSALIGSEAIVFLITRGDMAEIGLPLLAILSMTAFCLYTARRARLARGDLTVVIESLDRISNGNFEPLPAPTHIAEAHQIHRAVGAMAQRLKQTMNGLQDVAQRDPLTGLPNRGHFQRVVERQFQKAISTGTTCCMIFIDIDGFKSVNDTLGHNAGDRLLQIAAERLRVATRMNDVPDICADQSADDSACLARLGGDEFTVFLPHVPSDFVARKIASRILRVMCEPFELGAHTAGVGASIGVAFAPKDGHNCSEMLRAADTAMYHAKRSGRNRVEIYSAALDEEARKQKQDEQDLREALHDNQFELHYQPMYDCRTREINSAEALIRWRHPRRGLVMPGDFIPLAEKTNLICQIGEWVLCEAIQRIADLAREGRPLRISVNVSPVQLQQMEFIALVKSQLQRTGAPAHLLELEITEGVAMQDPELAADRLARLHRLGVSVALDDFGTGYSNLASLIRLPLSRLKVDRSLLQDLTLRPEVRVLAQTIISMANSLGLHTVAEGVETPDQLELLSVMGCDVAQGFLLSRPINYVQLRNLLHPGKPAPALKAVLINAA